MEIVKDKRINKHLSFSKATIEQLEALSNKTKIPQSRIVEDLVNSYHSEFTKNQQINNYPHFLQAFLKKNNNKE